jgi:protein TonB
MRSSGNPLFDESALRAISNIKQLRRPPQGMSKTLTVKFFPPTG